MSIESQAGVSTDSAGNAVVPNVTPYRSNRLALVTQDLDDSVDVKYAARDVVPTRGAVVLAPFETSVGYRLMLTLKGRDGRALPFGSRIENEAGQEVGIVGPEGQAYVSGAPEAGTLKVIWGQDAAAQCEVKYALPARTNPRRSASTKAAAHDAARPSMHAGMLAPCGRAHVVLLRPGSRG